MPYLKTNAYLPDDCITALPEGRPGRHGKNGKSMYHPGTEFDLDKAKAGLDLEKPGSGEEKMAVLASSFQGKEGYAHEKDLVRNKAGALVLGPPSVPVVWKATPPADAPEVIRVTDTQRERKAKAAKVTAEAEPAAPQRRKGAKP